MAQSFKPPPAPKPKPAKKKGHGEKTPKEVVDRQQAIAAERRRRGLGPASPQQSAQRSVEVAQAKEKITHAEFNRQKAYYDDIYMAYAGRKSTRGEALALISKGITATTLAKYLAKQPAFFHSDIWAANKDKFLGPARNMGMKIPKKFIATAIANNWDPYVFQEKLRTLPRFREQYLKSTEFKTTEAGLTMKFQQLYGLPDASWKQEIQRRALSRWSPEQWQSYLRTLPEYTQSSEYKTNVNSLHQILGLL